MAINYYDYIHNTSQQNPFETTDNSGIIFEFTAANGSSKYVKQFTYQMSNLGFSNVNAIAQFNILPSVLDNLFYFQTDNSLNLSNITKYGINTHFNFDLSYSEMLVTCGNVNTNGLQQIMNDYINYLSYTITNYNVVASSVFSNYNGLVQSVKNMDSSFNQTLNNNINIQDLQNGVVYFNDTNILLQNVSTLNPYVLSTKQLLDGMKYIATQERKDVFMNDITNQINVTNNQNIYWVPFHPNDKLSIVINFIPPNGDGIPIIGSTPIYTRRYKIVLNCVYAFLPDNMSHISYNNGGNLDPMYIANLIKIILMNSTSSMNGQNGIILESFETLDSSFVELFNNYGTTFMKYKGNDNISEFISLYKQIGYISNPLDYYFKTFMSDIRQPSIVNDGLFNNGINLSFQYILLNCTITTLSLPSLRTIKESLLTSPCNFYPTLNNIQHIKCDLNCDNSSNFIFRIYTRPIYTGFDNSFNKNDTFYGNYYDSILFNGTFDFTTFNLYELFPYWSSMVNSEYIVNTYYYNKGFNIKQINTLGEQQILSICIFTTELNSNVGIKNIELSYI